MIDLLVTGAIGLAIGSFTNVLIHRPTWRDVYGQPSHCPHCRHRLAWFDLIPVVSFILLYGRCRYCGRPISPQYPLAELALGASAILLWRNFGPSWAWAVHLALAALLVALAVIDLKSMLLPDRLILPALPLAILAFILRQGTGEWLSAVVGAAVGVGFLGLLYLLGRGQWMGLGDVKLAGVIGLLLGGPLTVAALLAAFLGGAAVSAVLLLLGRRQLKTAIPFGPFLVFGTLLALFWGERIIEQYWWLVKF